MKTHYRTCHLCEAMCGLKIEVNKDKVTSIKGDPEDPFSQGYICPKATAIQDIHEDPERLIIPQIKIDNQWHSMSWKKAIPTVAKNIVNLQKKYGQNAVALYIGNPAVHSYSLILYLSLFFEVLKTKNRYSATSVDQLPLMLASLNMYGHQFLIPVPDLDRTDFLLIIGANPLVSNGSFMTAPNMRKRLKELQNRGGQFITVDPRKTETAHLADEHIFIQPGSDVWLLLCIIHIIFKENLMQPSQQVIKNLDLLQTISKPYSPEFVEPLTGIPASRIHDLTLKFCSASKAVCYGRLGTCIQEFGGLASWLIQAINLLSGNFNTVGGTMFTTPALDIISLTSSLGEQGSFNRWQSRVQNLPEFSGEFPVITLGDEIESPGEGQIKGLITIAGNPVLSTPNGARLEKLLPQLEFMVSIDIYRNETTKHADIILPTTFALERDTYDIFGCLLAIRNFSKYGKRIFSKRSEARHDWEIILQLVKEIETVKGQSIKLLANPQYHLLKKGPQFVLDCLLKIGPYGDKFNPLSNGLNLKKLIASPHGIDLGPLKVKKLNSIDIAPAIFLKDLKRLKKSESKSSDEFKLIGRRLLRSNNSWMHNSYRLVKGPPQCTLMIHPDDAQSLDMDSGDTAIVTSRTGQIEVPIVITEDIKTGVVCLPHGWGHHRKGIKQQTAQQFAGVSFNDISDQLFFDQLTGNASLNGISVSIKKC